MSRYESFSQTSLHSFLVFYNSSFVLERLLVSNSLLAFAKSSYWLYWLDILLLFGVVDSPHIVRRTLAMYCISCSLFLALFTVSILSLLATSYWRNLAASSFMRNSLLSCDWFGTTNASSSTQSSNLQASLRVVSTIFLGWSNRSLFFLASTSRTKLVDTNELDCSRCFTWQTGGTTELTSDCLACLTRLAGFIAVPGNKSSCLSISSWLTAFFDRYLSLSTGLKSCRGSFTCAFYWCSWLLFQRFKSIERHCDFITVFALSMNNEEIVQALCQEYGIKTTNKVVRSALLEFTIKYS